MTTVETSTVVTAVFHHVFRYAHTPAEVEDLVHALVDEPPQQVAEVYVWDRPCRSFRVEDGPAFPDGRLRLTSQAGTGWDALNYVDPSAPDGRLVDSFNPAADPGTPALKATDGAEEKKGAPHVPHADTEQDHGEIIAVDFRRRSIG